MRAKPANTPKLLVILDDKTQDPTHILREACFAGARHFMWRARHLSPRDYYVMARALAEIATPFGACLLTHERLDVALAIAAHGTHLPGDGLPVEAARAVLGRDRILGQSLHHAHELRSAQRRDALTYATVSPIFTPTSKAATMALLGVEGLARLVKEAGDLPLLALGGITPERVSACFQAGAHGVVVLGGISHAPDPYEATRAYLDAIEKADALT